MSETSDENPISAFFRFQVRAMRSSAERTLIAAGEFMQAAIEEMPELTEAEVEDLVKLLQGCIGAVQEHHRKKRRVHARRSTFRVVTPK